MPKRMILLENSNIYWYIDQLEKPQKKVAAENSIMEQHTVKTVTLVDDKLLQEIKHRIVNAVPAEKIILFGSFAYGNPTGESDLDILVIMNSDQPRHKRSIPIYRALAGLLIQKDVVVYTPEEIKEWEDVPQAFVTTAIKKGRVIYEKKQA